MFNNNPVWHRIGLSTGELHFGENNITRVEVSGKTICVAKHHDNLFAFAYKCPHASGRMDQGFIDALGNVVCPVHRYRFSLKNGRNTSGEGYFLKTYPIRVNEDGVFVEF